ncbi:MAG: hypothetical protein WD065_12725 [Planctomycetaceae bacterium]
MTFPNRFLAMGFLALSVFANVTALADEERPTTQPAPSPFRLAWEKNFFTISGDTIPGGDITVMYLEAYCRPGSTDRDWGETTIGHKTELVDAAEDGKKIHLKCTLNDGVIVTHTITAVADGVQFDLVAKNPTKTASLADWAQPCVRVDRFTGRDQKTYLEKLFVFLDDELTRMPTPNWATKARYVPGQVWCPKGVNRNDVNPRPLSDDVPSNGLIGCFSSDETMILASAWQPYQELFQGVANCVHADFRIGGLKPGESKKIHGKLYIVPADVEALVKTYEREFPEHVEER